jgi:hypothetical protein
MRYKLVYRPPVPTLDLEAFKLLLERRALAVARDSVLSDLKARPQDDGSSAESEASTSGEAHDPAPARTGAGRRLHQRTKRDAERHGTDDGANCNYTDSAPRKRPRKAVTSVDGPAGLQEHAAAHAAAKQARVQACAEAARVPHLQRKAATECVLRQKQVQADALKKRLEELSNSKHALVQQLKQVRHCCGGGRRVEERTWW